MVSNHVHIWFLADQLWHAHRIPLDMPVLASGDAHTFPYAVVPWLVGALLWPIGGDRVVTVLLVAGAIGTVAATFWALPRLRRGWWAVAVLVNPALVAAVLLGQLPFLCAAAMFMTAIGLWVRRRPVGATLLAALSIATHPAVMLPISIVALVVGGRAEPHRRRQLAQCWLVAVVVAVPAIVMTATSPVVSQTSTRQQLVSLVSTVAVRILVLAVPVALDVGARRGVTARLPLVATVVFIGLLPLMWQPFLLRSGWHGVLRGGPPTDLTGFVGSPALQPGRVYRVLSGGDEKYDDYLVVRHGGVLDAELFPEGMHRGSFSGTADYIDFLRDRRVDTIIVTPGYATHFVSNEPQLVRSLAASPTCTDGMHIVAAANGPSWQTFDVEAC
jgi:hypothetical protein